MTIIRIFIHYIFLFFLLLLGSTFYYFGFTSSGLECIGEIIQHKFPQLEIEKINGKLFSKVELTNVSYHDANQQIKIKDLSLAWNPLALFEGKFEINAIKIDSAAINLKNNNSNSHSKFRMNDLAFLNKVILHQLNIKNLLIDTKYKNQDIHATANIDLNKNFIEFKNTHININEDFLNINGKLSHDWDIDWDLHYKNITSGGSITGPQLQPSIKAKITGDHVNIGNKDFNKFFAYLTGNIFAKKNHDLSANLNLDVLKKYQISALLNLPEFSKFTTKQPILGKIHVDTTDIKTLTKNLNFIKNPEGKITADLILSGNMAKPDIQGNINISQGKMTLPDLNLKISNFTLQGNLNKNILTYTGKFKSGEGLGEINGNVLLQESPKGILSLKGTNLLASNLDDYKVTVNPDIKVSLQEKVISVTGKVYIPDATISPKDFSKTVTLPSEVVFEDVKNKELPALPFLTALNIQVSLSDKINLKYENLKTKLGGSLTITELPGNDIRATGELHSIQGTYETYGQTLKILNGKLVFTGNSIFNPGLNIRAAKEVKTIVTQTTSNFSQETNDGKKKSSIYSGSQIVTVGVQILGTMDKPKISFFANPAGLSQTDILSYIIFGYPQSEAGATSALMLASNALNPGDSKFTNFSKKIQDKLGLQQLGLESTQVFDPSNGGSVTTIQTIGIGKQILPNLFLHYSRGLFNPVSIINLSYKLGKRWSIQSEASTMDTGADLLYSIEKD